MVPLPDDDLDLRPAAFVASDDQRVDASVLESALRRALPGPLVPRVMWHWPRDVSQEGKLPWRTLVARVQDASERAQLSPLSSDR